MEETAIEINYINKEVVTAVNDLKETSNEVVNLTEEVVGQTYKTKECVDNLLKAVSIFKI